MARIRLECKMFITDRLVDAAVLLVRLAHSVDPSFLAYHHKSGVFIEIDGGEE